MTQTRPASKRFKTVSAAPHAAMLIESLRDVGYSLESALADIIDNAITAGATTVSLFVDTASDSPRIAILDDGCGMTETQLQDAMRPGSRSPLESREGGDLGRFGLGLKTASFSQCRRLTVVTRHAGKMSAARWDLDYVSRVNDWLLEIPYEPSSISWADALGANGTLVLWEHLDRLTENDSTKEARQHLVRRLDEAADHLELVFHRFLAGERGVRKINILLNNRALVAFDPFHSTHVATIPEPVERIRVRGHDVIVQAFTLPHHKKVSAADWERYAGRAGYTRNQGFYVYRGKRLIIHATWFGLARQLELTKLARVRIDMPNELDDDWKIDVRKSSAHPPRHVRNRLRGIIEAIGAGSKRLYTTRGRRLLDDSRIPVWQRLQDKNEIRYRLNPDHPVITKFTEGLPEAMKQDFRGILELAGAGLPIDSLFADIGSQPERVAGRPMSDDTLCNAIEATFRHLVKSGMSAADIIEMLRATEPFRSSWEQTEVALRTLIEETRSDE
jgi:hypothetical protein